MAEWGYCHCRRSWKVTWPCQNVSLVLREAVYCYGSLTARPWHRDTTAPTLTTLPYLLARHPKTAKRFTKSSLRWTYEITVRWLHFLTLMEQSMKQCVSFLLFGISFATFEPCESHAMHRDVAVSESNCSAKSNIHALIMVHCLTLLTPHDYACASNPRSESLHGTTETSNADMRCPKSLTPSPTVAI